MPRKFTSSLDTEKGIDVLATQINNILTIDDNE